ncbi:hypothetical protein S7711_03835 [Stachybotrys chartarum IBT 7711]|uniref:WSC domain-containing protein n=1 Tax=Stachybotrys chartarum (strain CBS 109288 / IBT 7711) TaxID=1280523 RepID=A0A084AUC4_STACB|nr:hypothetical protein S7711_03835 [Stachybotrys chartarum IBT 7711]
MAPSLCTGLGIGLVLFLGGQVAAQTTSTYQYLGCYAEPSSGRALDKVKSDNAMTPQMCESICAESSYTYAGVEYGKECWCGNVLNANAKSIAESDCTSKCAGDRTQICGGSKKLNLYQRHSSGGSETGGDLGNVGDFGFQGCYVDSGNPRILTSRTGSDTMTLAMCATTCAGSAYMGLQYGRECWCGNDLAATAFNIDPRSCNMPCAGDSYTLCGAGGLMSVYKAGAAAVTYTEPTFTKMGCFADASTAHVLERSYVSDKMTISTCANWAKHAGLSFFAVKAGRECWAGSAFNVAVAKVNSDACSTPCKGDRGSLCGGTEQATVFAFEAAAFPNLPDPESVSVDLEQATLDNAVIQVFNGQQTIAMTPAAGGRASVVLPASATSNIPEDEPMSLSINMAVSPVNNVLRRQQETECVLTVMLGPTVWMTQRVVSTGGNFMVVQTPAQTGLGQSITIIQVCPNAPLQLNIGGITIGPPVPPSASTSTSTTVVAVPTTSSSASTIVPVPISTSTSSSTVASTTNLSQPGVTTILPVPTPPPSDNSLSTWGAGPYTSGTCTLNAGWSSSTCWMSGVPSATTGGLLAATFIPQGSWDEIMETCAGICNRFSRCNAYHYDNAKKVCIFYTGEFSEYVDGSYDPQYDSITWMDKSCYDCNIPRPTTTTSPVRPTTLSASQEEEATFSESQETSRTETQPSYSPSETTTSIEAESTYSPPGTITPSVTESANVPSETTTLPPTTTVPAILAQKAPSTVSTCSEGTADMCNLSGWNTPTATMGLIAHYTDVPANDQQWLYPVLQQDICATLCQERDDCEMFILDRSPRRSEEPWSCYLYNFNGHDHVMNSDNRSEWSRYQINARDCFVCPVEDDIPPPPPPPTALSSSSIPAEETWVPITLTSSTVLSTSTPGPSIFSPASTTTMGSPTMVTAPAVLTSNAPNSVSTCDWAPPDGMACSWSNRATPTTGLLAVYTGVPASPNGWFNARPQDSICARLCQENERCGLFALQRGGWTDPTPWNCYLWDAPGDWPSLIRISPIDFTYSNWVMHARTCFDCPAVEEPEGTSTASESLWTTPEPAWTSVVPPVNASITTFSEETLSITQSLHSSDPVPASQPLSTTAAWVTSDAVSTLQPNFTSEPTVTTSLPVITSTAPFPIFSAPAPSVSCDRATTGEFWNSCSISGYPQPTAIPLALATGISAVPLSAPDYESRYNQCGGLCAEIDGCTAYVLDRGLWPSSMDDWKCYFYDMNVRDILRSSYYQGAFGKNVWFGAGCYSCDAGEEEELTTAPSSWTTFTRSATSSVTIEPTTTTTSPSSTVIEPGAPAVTCVPNMDTDSCNIRGFAPPGGDHRVIRVASRELCASYCRTNWADCGSFMFIPSEGVCHVYPDGAWDTLGDSPTGGRAYRENVLDESSCYYCS